VVLLTGLPALRVDKSEQHLIGGSAMTDKKNTKCAHIPCLCEAGDGEKYCSEACRDAGSEDVEIACQCDHPECPLVA
jgi:hypothetical protein